MVLNDFVKELVDAWRNSQTQLNQGLDGIPENHDAGISAEKTVLNRLRNQFANERYTAFTRTTNSWTPADVIGLRRKDGIWHFALYQVKSSINEDSLTADIPERYTLPELAKLLKDNFRDFKSTRRNRNKKVLITMGYIGVVTSGSRNKVAFATPYSNRLTINKPELTNAEKTNLTNIMHRII